MTTNTTATRTRVLLAGLRAVIVLTVLCGLVYPFAMTGVAQALFRHQADGSTVQHDGHEVGSSLIGQPFDLLDASGQPRLFAADGREVLAHQDASGTTTYTVRSTGAPLPRDQSETVAPAPDPAWFQPRPSAGGYDPRSSGASNLGPENPELVGQIEQRKEQVAAFNAVAPSQVPADAVTASGSGLDPHISRQYALIQVDRVATTRHLPPDQVRTLVDHQVQGRVLGVLGNERVNVLELNLALARMTGPRG